MGISKLGIKGDWENSCQLWNRETKAKEVNNQGFFQKHEYQKKKTFRQKCKKSWLKTAIISLTNKKEDPEHFKS